MHTWSACAQSAALDGSSSTTRSGQARARAKPAGRTLTTGDYFGEMALLDGEPRSASVEATTELHVMRLPRPAFDDLIARHPAVARRLLVELGERVRRLEHEIAQS